MSKATFQIYFCGAALESGQMDVKELAPALLSIGSLIEECNRVLNDNKSTVAVRVTSFKDGSFGVSLELVQKLYPQLINAFSGDTVTAAVNILSLLGITGGAYGIISFLKKLKNRKIENVNKLTDGNIEIIFGTEKIIIDSNVLDLYMDIKVRKELVNTVKPLSKEGIDTLAFKYNNNVVESIDKKEALYFEAPEVEAEEEKIEESEFTATYSIYSLSFGEGNKWKLTDGTNQPFFVSIIDQNYLDKIDKSLVSFTKGDRLKVKLRMKSYETRNGLKTEYDVLEIINHTKPPPPPTQLSLSFNE